METNKIDKVFNDLYKNKTIQPSNSAWDRLSLKLESDKKRKRKKRILYFGYAATLLIFVTFSYLYLIKTSIKIESNEIIVNTKSLKKETISLPIDEKTELKKTAEESIIVQETPKKNQKINIVTKKNKKSIFIDQLPSGIENLNDSKIAQVKALAIDTTEIYASTEVKPYIENKPKHNRIKIDPLELLNAIENEQKIASIESGILTKAEKLKFIEKEIKNKGINISAEKLLAEVENNTEEKTFREKFLKSIKNNITIIATAISDRNK